MSASRSLVVLQVRGALLRMGCGIEALVVIEGLVMRLKVRIAAGGFRRIDHLAHFRGRPPAVGKRRIPRARIPDPVDVLSRPGHRRWSPGLRRQRGGIVRIGVQRSRHRLRAGLLPLG